MTTPISSIMEPGLPDIPATPTSSNNGANPNRSDPVRPSTAPGYNRHNRSSFIKPITLYRPSRST